jgi:hypothetical protein
MGKIGFILCALLYGALGFGTPAFSQSEEVPRIEVKLSRTEVYEGEYVVLAVQILNVEDPPPPRLEGIEENFSVESAGQQSLNSSQTFIINGRRTHIRKFGKEYRYKLIPRKTGFLGIPAPLAEVDGQILKGNSLTLKVVGPQDQDIAILEITSQPRSLYPLKPFVVTLKVWVKELPEPHTDQSPLSVQRDAPLLTIPWVDNLPEGLQAETDTQRWLNSKIARQFAFQQPAGFRINNITSGPSFFSNNSVVFDLSGKRMKRTDKSGRTQGYREYILERTLVAQQPGSYLLGPVTLKGVFATGRDRKGELKGEQIYGVARAVEILVKDVPMEGRPESYTGAMGTFEFTGKLVPTEAKVGDPLTLTLSLKGKGTLDRARAPALNEVPELAELFKVYEATEETKGHTRKFTYSLRPMQAGIEEFPAVAFSYFDVDRERYVTLRTDPIPLKIGEADSLAEEDIVSQTQEARKAAKRIEARKEGIFANITDMSALKDETVRVEVFAMLVGGMVVFYFLVSFVTHRIRRVSGDQVLQRRRSARGRAQARLRDGLARIKSGGAQEGIDLLRAALTGFVADAADLPEAGLTTGDVREKLAAFGMEQDLIDRTARFLEACDSARFGAMGSEGTELAAESQEVLTALQRAFHKQGRLR